MKIGSVSLLSPFAIAPMAGMTDTAFRRLVKRQGGCGLVVTEMVSAEGLVRGIDRTLEYAEYTEEERPISIQIFGGDPDKMAAAAQVVEGMGADIVDVNMGCPVPKIAKHDAGCSLMRDAGARRGGDCRDDEGREDSRHGEDARRVERRRAQRADAGEDGAGRGRRGDCGARPYRRAELQRTWRTGTSWRASPAIWRFPCSAAAIASSPRTSSNRLASGVGGVLVGRGVLRNPWILAQAADLAAGLAPRRITLEDRGRFLLDYINLLMTERRSEHFPAAARSHDRWVINKVRALGSWYTKGLEGGSHLRIAINSAESLPALRDLIGSFFFAPAPMTR